MFGFSIPKLLLLFLIILVVWYFFKFIEKQGRLTKKKQTTKNTTQNTESNNFKENDVEDLIKCPECGNYYSADSTCAICGSK